MVGEWVNVNLFLGACPINGDFHVNDPQLHVHQKRKKQISKMITSGIKL